MTGWRANEKKKGAAPREIKEREDNNYLDSGQARQLAMEVPDMALALASAA